MTLPNKNTEPPRQEGTPTPLPTVAEQVEQRKLARDAKASRFAEERRESLRRASAPEVDDDPQLNPPPVTDSSRDDDDDDGDSSDIEEFDSSDDVVDSSDMGDDADSSEADDFDDFGDEESSDGIADSNETFPDDDDFEDDDSNDKIKAWRQRVKEQGAKRKAAEARNVELEGEIESLESKLREVEEKSKHVSSSNINWETHANVQPMWNEFDNIVLDGARSFDNAASAKKFKADSQQKLLSEYYALTSKAKNSDDLLEADIAFATTLADRYDVDDGRSLVSSVKRAMEQYIAIDDTVRDLKEKHESGRLSVGVETYQRAVEPFNETLEDLGNVDEDFIETNPQSVEAVVGKRYANDKDFRAAADKHKKRIAQFVFGLRPLTQAEIDKAEKRASTKGLTAEEYLAAREENYQRQRKKFLNDVFYTGLAVEEFPEMKKIYDRYLANKKRKEGAKKVVRKSKDKTPPKKDESTKPKTKAIDREYVHPSRRDFTKR